MNYLMFWFQDELISGDSSVAFALKPILAPFYLSLVDILLFKSMFPEKRFVEEHWNSDTHTTFRCYRQDINDTMVSSIGYVNLFFRLTFTKTALLASLSRFTAILFFKSHF